MTKVSFYINLNRLVANNPILDICKLTPVSVECFLKSLILRKKVQKMNN